MSTLAMIKRMLVFLAVLLAPVVARGQIFVDYPTPPTTLAKMFEQADAVVLARVVGGQQVRAGDANKLASDYPVIVLEKFKGEGLIPASGAGLTVRRLGGMTDKNGEVGFPRFEAGAEYVLFLRWSTALQGWIPSFGPDSVMVVSPTGSLKAFGYRGPFRKLSGARASGLIDQLRQLSRY